MPAYDYKARSKSGDLVSGVLEADNPEMVASQLDVLGYFPISIRHKAAGGIRLPSMKGIREAWGKVKPEDFILLNRQMATLISSGIPFLRCLDAISEQTASGKLRSVLQDIRVRVEGGSSFSEALAAHPGIFSDLYVNMVRAGEEGGMLDVIMDRLAVISEHEALTRARVKSATRYPLLVVAAIIVVVVVLLWLVVPQFVRIFERFHAELPLPTRVLIGVNWFFRHYWLAFLAAVAAAVLLVRTVLRTPAGRAWWHRTKLHLPIFGPLFLKVAMSRFARVFGSLTATGIPILQTLDISSRTAGNVYLEKVIRNIRDSVHEGESLAAPMGMSMVFPPIVVQMVAVGEETGHLDEMLTRVSDYFDMEVEFAIRNLTTALEPLLIFFIGGIILFLALAIFLPWWNLINVVR